MKTTQHIFIGFFILVFLSSGIPLFSPEDASRDCRIDLEDAILLVQDFIQLAEASDAFNASIDEVISAFQIVASMKTVIQPDDPSFSPSSSHTDLTTLVSSFSFSPPFIKEVGIFEFNTFFCSHIIAPDSPPPKTIIV